MQELVESQTDPAYMTRIIKNINKHCAKRLSGLALRLPQPDSIGHCIYAELQWTKVQAERFAQDGTLPYDHATMDPAAGCVLLWLFDATAAGGELPEVELDPVPDFEKFPALCGFDMDGGSKFAVIPSEDLRGQFKSWSTLRSMCGLTSMPCATVVPTGKDKIRFVLKDGRPKDFTIADYIPV